MNKDLIASLEQLTQQVRDQDKTHAQIIKDIRIEILREMEKEIAKVVQQATRDAIQNLIERFDLMPKPQPARGLLSTQEVNEELERMALAAMTDDQHSSAYRRRKATEATHRISNAINHPKYKELRDNGFCEGMKFVVLRQERTHRGTVSICLHPRTGRKAAIHAHLLSEMRPSDF